MVTLDINDSIDYKPVTAIVITSITGQSNVQSRGTVKWYVYDDVGKKHVIKKAYYMPAARM